MNKFLLAGLAAITLIPSVAVAQPHQRTTHERPNVHQDRRDYDARQRHNREIRDYDRRNPWRAAPFKYQRFKAGTAIRPTYYGRNYIIRDYRRFGWSTPRANQQWVRHYNDALLVNTRSGRVMKVIPNAFRHR